MDGAKEGVVALARSPRAIGTAAALLAVVGTSLCAVVVNDVYINSRPDTPAALRIPFATVAEHLAVAVSAIVASVALAAPLFEVGGNNKRR